MGSMHVGTASVNWGFDALYTWIVTPPFEQMLDETDRKNAPWTLVEADSKRYARVKVIETVIAAAEDGMRRHGMKVPKPL